MGRDKAPPWLEHCVPVYCGKCDCTADLPPLQMQVHRVMSKPKHTTVLEIIHDFVCEGLELFDVTTLSNTRLFHA